MKARWSLGHPKAQRPDLAGLEGGLLDGVLWAWLWLVAWLDSCGR